MGNVVVGRTTYTKEATKYLFDFSLYDLSNSDIVHAMKTGGWSYEQAEYIAFYSSSLTQGDWARIAVNGIRFPLEYINDILVSYIFRFDLSIHSLLELLFYKKLGYLKDLAIQLEIFGENLSKIRVVEYVDENTYNTICETDIVTPTEYSMISYEVSNDKTIKVYLNLNKILECKLINSNPFSSGENFIVLSEITALEDSNTYQRIIAEQICIKLA